MKLSPEQIEQLATWVRAGASLSDIQKRLVTEYGLQMTYLDVRFLVDDLELALVDKPKPVAPEKPLNPPASPAGAAGTPAPQDEADDASLSPAATGAVTVDIDPITRPGALASGSVGFSDGQKAQWYLDQTGRLGLIPPSPGYKPNEADVMAFQQELQKALERIGF